MTYYHNKNYDYYYHNYYEMHNNNHMNDDDDDLLSMIVNKSSYIALIGLKLFLFIAILIVLWNIRHLFFSFHGWSHRLVGGIHLIWIIIGSFLTTKTTTTTTTTTIDNNNQNQNNDNHDDDYLLFLFHYDIILGILGIVTTLTAANDFPHKYVTNTIGQSGTLHSKAIVTQEEMIEHAFYQGLNLLQALYLHAIHYYYRHYSYYYDDDDYNNNNQHNNATINHNNNDNDIISLLLNNFWRKKDYMYRLLLLWFVTAPWLFRHKLPVHSFSHNWKIYQQQKLQQQKNDKKDNNNSNNNHSKNMKASSSSSSSSSSFEIEVFLYKIKKLQYLFYKHVILHGVNISIALSSSSSIIAATATTSTTSTSTSSTAADIPYSKSWRIFWLLLNTSYVMEFFLQTLVKRNIISQYNMLLLQRLLIIASSLSAICILKQLYVSVCILSLCFNFINRYHDVFNTILIFIIINIFILSIYNTIKF